MKRSRPVDKSELAELDLDVALQLLRQAGSADGLEGPAGAQRNGTRLQTIIDRLCELSQRDALTGLANARHFRAALEQEVDRVSRSGEIALLLLVDLDYLKTINDKYGHLAGDQALQKVAQVLAKNVRPMDTAARYGGDEFAVILPNCRPGAGQVIAERIREQVEQTGLGMPDGTTVQLTTSIGGAHVSPWSKVVAEDAMKKADEELYRAKARGRNQVSMDIPVVMPISFDEELQLLHEKKKDEDE